MCPTIWAALAGTARAIRAAALKITERNFM
jgi:hypothetical protein